jgi:hypothetical protein
MEYWGQGPGATAEAEPLPYHSSMLVCLLGVVES